MKFNHNKSTFRILKKYIKIVLVICLFLTQYQADGQYESSYFSEKTWRDIYPDKVEWKHIENHVKYLNNEFEQKNLYEKPFLSLFESERSPIEYDFNSPRTKVTAKELYTLYNTKGFHSFEFEYVAYIPDGRTDFKVVTKKTTTEQSSGFLILNYKKITNKVDFYCITISSIQSVTDDPLTNLLNNKYLIFKDIPDLPNQLSVYFKNPKNQVVDTVQVISQITPNQILDILYSDINTYNQERPKDSINFDPERLKKTLKSELINYNTIGDLTLVIADRVLSVVLDIFNDSEFLSKEEKKEIVQQFSEYLIELLNKNIYPITPQNSLYYLYKNEKIRTKIYSDLFQILKKIKSNFPALPTFDQYQLAIDLNYLNNGLNKDINTNPLLNREKLIEDIIEEKISDNKIINTDNSIDTEEIKKVLNNQTPSRKAKNEESASNTISVNNGEEKTNDNDFKIIDSWLKKNGTLYNEINLQSDAIINSIICSHKLRGEMDVLKTIMLSRVLSFNPQIISSPNDFVWVLNYINKVAETIYDQDIAIKDSIKGQSVTDSYNYIQNKFEQLRLKRIDNYIICKEITASLDFTTKKYFRGPDTIQNLLTPLSLKELNNERLFSLEREKFRFISLNESIASDTTKLSVDGILWALGQYFTKDNFKPLREEYSTFEEIYNFDFFQRTHQNEFKLDHVIRDYLTKTDSANGENIKNKEIIYITNENKTNTSGTDTALYQLKLYPTQVDSTINLSPIKTDTKAFNILGQLSIKTNNKVLTALKEINFVFSDSADIDVAMSLYPNKDSLYYIKMAIVKHDSLSSNKYYLNDVTVFNDEPNDTIPIEFDSIRYYGIIDQINEQAVPIIDKNGWRINATYPAFNNSNIYKSSVYEIDTRKLSQDKWFKNRQTKNFFETKKHKFIQAFNNSLSVQDFLKNITKAELKKDSFDALFKYKSRSDSLFDYKTFKNSDEFTVFIDSIKNTNQLKIDNLIENAKLKPKLISSEIELKTYPSNIKYSNGKYRIGHYPLRNFKINDIKLNKWENLAGLSFLTTGIIGFSHSINRYNAYKQSSTNYWAEKNRRQTIWAGVGGLTSCAISGLFFAQAHEKFVILSRIDKDLNTQFTIILKY